MCYLVSIAHILSLQDVTIRRMFCAFLLNCLLVKVWKLQKPFGVKFCNYPNASSFNVYLEREL